MIRYARAAILACVLPLLTLSLSAAAATDSAATRNYVDLSDRLNDDAEIEAWYTAMHRLRHDFDQICGDTFCEGDYSNIYALRFRCSVDDTSGVVGQCVWIFAASNEEIAADTGRISVQPKAWRCRLPLAPRTSASALLGALAVERPLYATLPGTSKSIYDGLADCL
ncbi:hypothetical protein [Lysobacter sp. CA199]|uniref:hypothetical protein n=1 Tax=Lysobacter sp. CA199 TaxID=3455608 RepID=UPI003F8D881A